ncbi:MAG: IclR family transcriptional regulator [Pusillimonas sp.]|nr:IclR family transcriptional regulator [Pusillimonas sp.]
MAKPSSAERMLSIPRLFTEQRPSWTVEEVAAELGLPVSTTYRYFQSLLRFEYLDEAPGQGYCLGPAFIEYERIIRVTDPLAKVAGPILTTLGKTLPPGSTLILCQVYRRKVMCIHEQSVGNGLAHTSYERGRPMPLYRGATSKVILAHQPWRTQKREYEQNQAEIQAAGMGHDWKSFSAGLRNIRKLGYCVSRGEVDEGRMGIAAPIFNGTNHVAHSLSIVTLDQKISTDAEGRLITDVVNAATCISKKLSISVASDTTTL